MLLLVVGVIVGFTVTSIGAQSTGELSLDVTIADHRDGVLTWLARFVNVGFGPLVAPALLLVSCAIVWQRSRFAALSVAGLTIIGWLSVEAGKVLVHRMRPPAATVQALVVESKPDSYPCGHTAFAAALVFAIAATMLLAQHSTRTVWLVAMPFIVIVAASRLYLGAHYLSDVIASPVFAAGTVLIAVAIAGPCCFAYATAKKAQQRDDTAAADRPDAGDRNGDGESTHPTTRSILRPATLARIVHGS